MNNGITVEHLTKKYNDHVAVNDISFNLEAGEIFGFLGPNGAGKTTTIKMLIGMITPSEGVMSVMGINPMTHAEDVHKIAGVLTEHAGMYNELTGLENLMYYGGLYGINKTESKTRALELLEKIDLIDAKDKKLGAYSTGMRQRLSLARALMHRPKLLFLDEPTSGLDPESSKKVNQIIIDLAKNGTTIFLCTHQLRYAEEVCTRYGLINNGKLFANGTLDELRLSVKETFKVTIKSDMTPVNVKYERVDHKTYQLEVTSEDEVAKVVTDLVKNGGNVYGVNVSKLNLEEIYFALTHQNAKGADVDA